MFNVKNFPDVTYIDQAEPDAGDFAALGERSTGVLFGCLVSAQVSAALAVDIGAGAVVVGGTPVNVVGGTVTITAGEAQPRFDLVVVDRFGAKQVVKGTAGTNPLFPTFDPTLLCLLASVYVRQAVTSIAVNDVMDKRVTVAATFQRNYAAGSIDAIVLNDTSVNKRFGISADGTHTWVGSILKRTSDKVMDWTTSLVVRAADATVAALVLKASGGDMASQHVLEVQPSGSEIPSAYITGDGRLFADNFKFGIGTPEGNVVARQGTLYVDMGASDGNAALFVKLTALGATGWQAFRKQSNLDQSLDTGTVVAFLGDPASPPANLVYLNGQLLSSTAPENLNLLNMIGNAYGGTVGVNFGVPDWRGVSPMGAMTGVIDLGQKLGTMMQQLSAAQMPKHVHRLVQEPHEHPIPGFEYLWSPPSEPTPIRAMGEPGPLDPSSGRPIVQAPGVPFMKIAQLYFNRTANANITMETAGADRAFSVLSPSVGCHWMVRR